MCCVNGILGQFVLPSYVPTPFPSVQEISAERREWFPLQQNHGCDSTVGGAGPAWLHTVTAGTQRWNGNPAAQAQILIIFEVQWKLKWASCSVERMIGLLGRKWRKFSIRNGTVVNHVVMLMFPLFIALDICCLKEMGWIIRRCKLF